MKKTSVLTLAVLVFAVFSFQTAPAQIPKIKIPKPAQPKPTPGDTTEPTQLPKSNAVPAQPQPQPADRGTSGTAATAPTINKPSVQIRLQTHQQYYRDGQRDDQTWSWTPVINFRVNGPITPGSQLSVEYSLPASKPWLKFDCATEEAGANSWSRSEDCGLNPGDEKAVTYTGPVDFKINLKNELEGANQTLLAGRFKVEKFHVGVVDLPKFKNNFAYYVDYDWNLPIGYVYGEDVAYTEKPAYRTAPQSLTKAHLMAAFWFKGDKNALLYSKSVAYLYYQGKIVADSKQEGSNYGDTECEITNDPEANQDSPYSYCRRMFALNALVWDKNPEFSPNDYPMYKNPGEYEIKVLQNGRLARAAKFTMASDGRLVDTGIGPKNNLGTSRIVIPAQIVGDQDGQWDRNAYKTDAFFGNPLNGFVVP